MSNSNTVGLLQYLPSDTEQNDGPTRYECAESGCSNMVSVNGAKCSIHDVWFPCSSKFRYSSIALLTDLRNLEDIIMQLEIHGSSR